MKKIIFRRPKENFNQGIPYQIFIGNKVLTEINNGEEKTIEISSKTENKTVKARIHGFWGSGKIELNSLSENEILNIKGNKFLNRNVIFLVSLLSLTGAFIFGYGKENALIRYVGIGLFVLILILTVGILTMGRNKWLKIEKID